MERSPDFLKGDIPLLIRQLAVPVSIGFFFNTMYNVVDTWYAGLVSTSGIAALTLSFPVFFTIIALGNGISTATTAIVSQEFGKLHQAKGDSYFAQSLFFSGAVSLALLGGGLLLMGPLLHVMSTDNTTIALAREYLQIIFLGTPFFILQSTFNSALTARGDTRSFRDVLIGGFFLNLALDPLLLLGYSPLHIPALGVSGIALATVLIQGAGMVYLARQTVLQGCYDGLSVRNFYPRKEMLREIAGQALPAALSMMLVAVGILIINSFVSRAGDTAALAAYGIAMRIEQIALLPTIGIGMAMLTIAGHNAGAGRYDRIRIAVAVALRYGAVVMAAMLSVILPFASFWVSLFDDNPTVVSMGTQYLHVEMVTFYAYVILFLVVSMLQGLKRPMPAVWLGLYRQVVGPALLFSVLVFQFQLPVIAIWWGICFINWSAAIFALFYGRRLLARGVAKVTNQIPA